MMFFRKIARLADPSCPISRGALIWIALTVVLVDQVTKLWAVLALKGANAIVIVPGFLQLYYRTNTGAAFSILSEHTALLAVFSAAISVVLLVWAWRLPAAEQGLRIAIGLILGGAVGNLIDRVRMGEVIDFIDAHWLYKMHWPTFNVADSAVCVGMFLMVAASFRLRPQERERLSDGTPDKQPAQKI